MAGLSLAESSIPAPQYSCLFAKTFVVTNKHSQPKNRPGQFKLISDSPTAEQAVTAKKGSPWSNLGRKLTDDEWEALKRWRKDNPELVYCRGDQKSDMFFWNYGRGRKSGEIWFSKQDFETNKILILRYGRKASYVRRRRSKYSSDYSNPELAGVLRKRCRDYMRRMRRDPLRREVFLERTRLWRKKHKDAVREQTQKRWTNKKAMTHPDCNHQAVRELHLIATQCGGSREYDVDHIIPLRAGGRHHHQNVQVLPKTINAAKGAKQFWLSDEYLDFRDVPEFLWPEHLKPHYQFMLRLFGHPLKKYAETV